MKLIGAFVGLLLSVVGACAQSTETFLALNGTFINPFLVAHAWAALQTFNGGIAVTGTLTQPLPQFQVLQGNVSNLAAPVTFSAAIDAAIGSTRGSVLERGVSTWGIITPGTSGLPWVSNGAAADPGYQPLANSGFANMAAKTVKSNNTTGSAAPADNTTLPNPFSAGTSLYPILNGFEFDTNSAFGANTLGAKSVMVGVPAATLSCCTWLNTYLSGVDVVGITTLYSIAPPGTSALWTTVTAARSSDTSSVGIQNIIPSNCVEVHDNTSVGHQNWCGYDAAYITATAAAGRTLGREISVFNTGTASTAEDAFTFNPTVPSSEGLRIDCAAAGGFGGNDCGAALALVPNGAKFKSGILCINGALDTGATANPDCFALPPTYSITWYNAAAAKTWQLFAGTGANGDLNLNTGGTGAFKPTALQETTGQAYSTYTPSLTCGTGTVTTSTSTGRFRQLGKTIFLQLNIVITTLGTCATTIAASLPFTVGSMGAVLVGRDSAVSGKTLSATLSAGGTTAVIANYDNTFPAASGANFIVTGTFERN